MQITIATTNIVITSTTRGGMSSRSHGGGKPRPTTISGHCPWPVWIWLNGQLVTDRWLGDAADPPLETSDDYRRASRFIAISGISAAAAATAMLLP